MTRATDRSELDSAIAAVTTTTSDRLNLLADSAAAEQIGAAVSEQLVGLDLDCIVIWEDIQPAVLAHVVARTLGCATLRVYEVEGLVELLDEATTGSRAALVAVTFPTENSVNALLGRARHSGLNVVAAVAVLPSQALAAAAESGELALAVHLSGEPR